MLVSQSVSDQVSGSVQGNFFFFFEKNKKLFERLRCSSDIYFSKFVVVVVFVRVC